MNSEHFETFFSIVEVDLISIELKSLIGILFRLIDLSTLFLHIGQFKIVMCKIGPLLDFLIVVLLCFG